MTKSRRCGLKSEERDCDATDRDGTDFDDGICACTEDDCNKYVPLRCYQTDNSIMNCRAPPSGKTAACLTERKGLEKF